MKTLTEFAGFALKNAARIKNELIAAGKSAEELPAAMGEALKLEGEKLTHLMNALSTVGEKLNDLKRVLVHSLTEGEKAPSGAQQHGEHYYSVEHHAARQAPAREEERGGRGGRDGKRGDKRGDKRGAGGGRGGRDGKPGEGRGAGGPGGSGGGPGRGPRGPRPEGAPVAVSTGPRQLPKPKSVGQAPAAAPASEAPAASAEAPKSES